MLPDLGARIHRLRAFGIDVLRTPDDVSAHRREPFFWGAYVMAPWCNRIAARATPVAGRRVEVPATFPDGTAIHGQVHSVPWELVGDGRFRVEGGGGGWPWRYEATMAITIVDASVGAQLRLTNIAHEAMPGGVGLHPWFRSPDAITLRADRAYADVGPGVQPTAVTGDFDLRTARRMPLGLDAAWTDLGQPAAALDWAIEDALLRLTLTVATSPGYLVAASPAGLDAVAVEPQTHAPQGLERLVRGEPGGLAMLEPGETLALDIEMAFELVSRA